MMGRLQQYKYQSELFLLAAATLHFNGVTEVTMEAQIGGYASIVYYDT